jgi:hypothetical protein
MTLTKTEMKRVNRIREWANDNYDKGGSYLIECHTTEELVNNFPTITSAQQYAKINHQREQEVRNC